MGFTSWKSSIINLHNPDHSKDLKSIFFRRLAYDEIFANLLFLSKNRYKIKRSKKNQKKFDNIYSEELISKLPFKLTKNQLAVSEEINSDLKSSKRMYRILQGDVGSGKTIVAFLSALNVKESNFQSALMAPTEILAQQHFDLLSKILKKTNLKIKISLLTGKTERKKKSRYLEYLYIPLSGLQIHKQSKGVHKLPEQKIDLTRFQKVHHNERQ